ncbi:hypothetical protein LINGRAHAP2_LOCUS36168 [Linum grandiflorum]
MSNERRSSSSSSSSGCFSAVARLLLCKRNLQTHPNSDLTPDRRLNQNNKDHYFDCQEEANEETQISTPAAPAPGVVARLMGLESLPPTPPARRRASSAAADDSVTRSRSVNFMDYYLLQHDFDFSSSNGRHRRVRTSVSFREVSPAATAPDFILLYLENTTGGGGRGGGINSKAEKPKKTVSSPKAIRKVDQIRNKNTKSRETEQKQKQRTRKQSSVHPVVKTDRGQPRKKANRHSHKYKRKCAVNQKEAAVESKFMKKIKNRKFVSDGTGSSCPISSVPPPLSGKRSCETKLERKQSPAAENQDEAERYVAKLTEEDVKLSFWVAGKGGNVAEYEGFEEICEEFEQELLDLLVEELVFRGGP